MNVSEISIKKPVFAWMLMVAMMLFGFLSFREMGVSQLPDVDLPVININVTWEGAAPDVIESDVVDTLESAVMSVEGVETITSSIKRGTANITVEFGLNKNLDVAVNDIQNKLSQAQRRLPTNVDPPVVSKSNPEDQPIMWLSVSDDTLTPKDLMTYLRDNVRDKFLTTNGVADIQLSGYVDPNLRVWVDDRKLNSLELTVTDIINTITSEHAELPSGQLDNNKIEFAVRTLGEATDVNEFSKLSINKRGSSPNYTPIALGRVARIEDGLNDVTRRSRVMGKSSVGIGIKKQRGSNSVAVAESVYKKIDELNKFLPPTMKIGVNYDSTRFIKESVRELSFTLILSAILTALVCWAFLGSWSATFNVILAIPTSILGSFVVLKAMNFTLNYFTLLGLSLSIGIVVDDAIMVLENIFRHFEMGKDKTRASLDGAKEITFAAIAATIAIIAIFLPIAYMKGIIGKYFYQFAVTISVAVFLSLIEALTLTPMRCAQFMSHGSKRSRFGQMMDNAFSWFEKLYKKTLPFVIKHRLITIFISIIIFVISSTLVMKLRKEFVPPQDQSSIFLIIKTKEGSSLDFSDNKVKEVEAYLKNRPEIERSFVAIGGAGGGDSSSSIAFLTLKSKKDRKYSQQELIEIYRKDFRKLQGVRVIVQDTSLGAIGGSGRGFPIEFSIAGNEWDKLIASSKATMKDMTDSGVFVDVDSNYRENVKELNIIPNRDKARLHGISISDLGITVNALVGGAVIGKFTQNGHRYDIRIRLENIKADDIERIKAIKLRNNRGELVRISDIGEVKFKDGVQAITRQERARAISVYANIKAGYSQASALELAKTMASKHLFFGAKVIESGSAKTFRESFESLIFVLILGIAVSYMVLASQFNSFFDPITVLVALPFSVSGAFVALYLKNQSINIYSLIGIILLMGIVKKNSILLVDFTNQVRDHEKKNIHDALLEACPKRLRPIIMTSFATIAGAIPAAFAFGPGAESLSPMAMSVIGGVLVSTFLTLLVVPAIYSLLSPNERKHVE
ncbi:MAG: efflux RND transporter permease subunit [Bacteriovorax sp.]|nr:efflux RND transporter permease subunit [Bacteriovorax sp.]